MGLKTVIALCAGALMWSGCGVKQYNSKVKKPGEPSVGEIVRAYGPFQAAGLGNGAMAPSTCGSVSGRPCTRARVSVGAPFQFDVNPNDTQGKIAGTTYPAPAVAYGGVAGPSGKGAGRTAALTGVHSDLPAVDNKDLKLIKRQVGSGEHVF